jgi:hypothetical protein
LHFNLYEQADLLASKAPFPEAASNNQAARYLYYMGAPRSLPRARVFPHFPYMGHLTWRHQVGSGRCS